VQELDSSSRQNDEAAREETCPSDPSKPTPAKTSLHIQLVSSGCMDQLEGPRGGGGERPLAEGEDRLTIRHSPAGEGTYDALVKDATKSR
jgi:hypothetical protein